MTSLYVQHLVFGGGRKLPFFKNYFSYRGRGSRQWWPGYQRRSANAAERIRLKMILATGKRSENLKPGQSLVLNPDPVCKPGYKEPTGSHGEECAHPGGEEDQSSSCARSDGAGQVGGN